MRSRVSTIACFLALVATLWVAALHRHLAPPSGPDSETAACAYCGGGLSAADPIRFEPVSQLALMLQVAAIPEAPALEPTLPLAHSGNAPPSFA